MDFVYGEKSCYVQKTHKSIYSAANIKKTRTWWNKS